jgi:hypothetical protein
MINVREQPLNETLHEEEGEVEGDEEGERGSGG